MQYLLFTGATGLLGRYVLRELLDADVPIAAVVRAGRIASAHERLESVMTDWEVQLGRAMPRPVLIEGDLNLPGLGISAADLRWISRYCDGLVHCAASMTFRPDDSGEPWRTNVNGTAAALQLCHDAGLRHIHHVSTAYVCGLRQGRVLESELDVGQTLGNVYEDSKLQGEKLVLDAEYLDTRTIYRPASIVGDSQSGFTSSYHGFYLPLQLAYTMSGKIPPEEMGERFFAKLGLSGDEGKNFVPVDWVGRAMASIVLRPELHGGTYHLAHSEPVPVRLMQEVIRDAIREYSPRPTALKANPQHLPIYERMFREHMAIYRSHWRDDPVFDLTASGRALASLPCPRMDRDLLMRVARYPIVQSFRSPRIDAAEPCIRVADHLPQVGIDAENGSTADGFFSLQVNGGGGGQWIVSYRADRVIGAERGRASDDAARCYLSARTFAALVDGGLSIEQAIGSGQLVVERAGDNGRPLYDLLRQIMVADDYSTIGAK